MRGCKGRKDLGQKASGVKSDEGGVRGEENWANNARGVERKVLVTIFLFCYK